jgi:hypothetical protein
MKRSSTYWVILGLTTVFVVNGVMLPLQRQERGDQDERGQSLHGNLPEHAVRSPMCSQIPNVLEQGKRRAESSTPDF